MMRFCRVLFIVALSVLKSEGNNHDKDCFKFDQTQLVNPTESLDREGSVSNYALVNLTHGIHIFGSEDVDVWSTSFWLESGHQKVVELNAEGELPEENPRELTIAFDGTHIAAAIGEHVMFDQPFNETWTCWNMNRPLILGDVLREHTTFCRNYTAAGNETRVNHYDTVKLEVEISEGNKNDRDCFKFDQTQFVKSTESLDRDRSGPEYAEVKVTHSRDIFSSEQREAWDSIVIWSSSFRLESGHQKVVQLNATGELPEENPRELTIAFDGTQIEAAIGEHVMFGPPFPSEWWECWNMSRPLIHGDVLWEYTSFCRNYTDTENGTKVSHYDHIELEVQKHWNHLPDPLLPLSTTLSPSSLDPSTTTTPSPPTTGPTSTTPSPSTTPSSSTTDPTNPTDPTDGVASRQNPLGLIVFAFSMLCYMFW